MRWTGGSGTPGLARSSRVAQMGRSRARSAGRCCCSPRCRTLSTRTSHPSTSPRCRRTRRTSRCRPTDACCSSPPSMSQTAKGTTAKPSMCRLAHRWKNATGTPGRLRRSVASVGTPWIRRWPPGTPSRPSRAARSRAGRRPVAPRLARCRYLDDGPTTGSYRTGARHGVPSGVRLSRSDTAHLMPRALDVPATIGQAVGAAD